MSTFIEYIKKHPIGCLMIGISSSCSLCSDLQTLSPGVFSTDKKQDGSVENRKKGKLLAHAGQCLPQCAAL